MTKYRAAILALWGPMKAQGVGVGAWKYSIVVDAATFTHNEWDFINYVEKHYFGGQEVETYIRQQISYMENYIR